MTWIETPAEDERSAESDIELSPEDHDHIVENLQELSYF